LSAIVAWLVITGFRSAASGEDADLETVITIKATISPIATPGMIIRKRLRIPFDYKDCKFVGGVLNQTPPANFISVLMKVKKANVIN
jgi:hypothetical protein